MTIKIWYISRTYAKNIGEGENYSELKRTIGVLIADFKIKGLEELKYHTKYQLIEEKNRKIILTDKIEIHIIEIKKRKPRFSTQWKLLENLAFRIIIFYRKLSYYDNFLRI